MIAMPRSASTSIAQHLSLVFRLKNKQILHFLPGAKTHRMKKLTKLKNIFSTDVVELKKLHGDAIKAPKVMFRSMAVSKTTLFKQHFTSTTDSSSPIIFLHSTIDDILNSYHKIASTSSGVDNHFKTINWRLLEDELTALNDYWLSRSNVVITKQEYIENPIYREEIAEFISQNYFLDYRRNIEIPHLRKTQIK